MTAGVFLTTFVVVLVLGAVAIGLRLAENRGWVRLRGSGKGSAALAFAAVEDLFAPSRNAARQHLEEQKHATQARPSPDDGLDPAGPGEPGDARRFRGRITLD